MPASSYTLTSVDLAENTERAIAPLPAKRCLRWTGWWWDWGCQ